jgi:hypothetical protein
VSEQQPQQHKLSADGLYYWDGKQWVTTLSPDGRSRWDGGRWIPLPQVAPPATYAPVPFPVPQKPARMPTSWTRPMQYAVAAAFTLWGLYSISVPFWMSSAMDQYMRQVALRQAQQAPEVYPDPNQYADMMSSIGTVSLVIGVVIAAAIAIVVVIGTFKLWTWLFWVVIVLLALQVVGLPFQIANAFGAFSALTPGLSLPPALTWISVVAGLAAAALAAWMVVAALTRGPWAMRRPASGAQ